MPSARLAVAFKQWRTGSLGREVEGRGARRRPWKSMTGIPDVTISITADRVAKLAPQCESMYTYGDRSPKAAVRQLAGLASMVATLRPQLSAYTACHGGPNFNDHADDCQTTTENTSSLAPNLLPREVETSRVALSAQCVRHQRRDLRRFLGRRCVTLRKESRRNRGLRRLRSWPTGQTVGRQLTWHSPK